MNYGYKVTAEGRELLAALLATGKELEITRVAVGSGKVAEDVNLADMTDLIQYVAEGAIAQRRHQDNILYLTVQYASNSTPGLGAFYLAEFIVQAKHPVTEENVTLLYATLGDYIQPVNAYSESQPPDIRNYPLMLVISDEINVSVSAPAGLVTYDDLAKAVEEACKDLVDTMASGGIKKTIDFTIPAEAWVEDPQAVNGYGFYYDLIDMEITKHMIPDITVAEDSLETAKLCGVCATATSYTGFVRVKCVERPTAGISASCNLLVRGATGGGGSGDAYTLPVATPDTLGGIKESATVQVDEDGTAHAVAAEISDDCFASDAEVDAALNDIFGKEP